MLDDAIKFVGEESMVQAVTDNAANFKVTGKTLMETWKNLYWTSCVAHCINLIVEDFERYINVHKDTIKKGRKITTYIYGRIMLISMLKKFTNRRDLVSPDVTRFATSFLTLACLNELKASLMSMFSSNEWKLNKFATAEEGGEAESVVLDSQFWKNVICCPKAAAPLIEVLRLVDFDEKPTIGFIYEGNYKKVKKSAYYLNPQLHFGLNFRKEDVEVKPRLFNCFSRLISDATIRNKINLQIKDFHLCKGLFSCEFANKSRLTRHLVEWWQMYGDSTPKLKKFVIVF